MKTACPNYVSSEALIFLSYFLNSDLVCTAIKEYYMHLNSYSTAGTYLKSIVYVPDLCNAVTFLCQITDLCPPLYEVRKVTSHLPDTFQASGLTRPRCDADSVSAMKTVTEYLTTLHTAKGFGRISTKSQPHPSNFPQHY